MRIEKKKLVGSSHALVESFLFFDSADNKRENFIAFNKTIKN